MWERIRETIARYAFDPSSTSHHLHCPPHPLPIHLSRCTHIIYSAHTVMKHDLTNQKTKTKDRDKDEPFWNFSLEMYCVWNSRYFWHSFRYCILSCGRGYCINTIRWSNDQPLPPHYGGQPQEERRQKIQEVRIFSLTFPQHFPHFFCLPHDFHSIWRPARRGAPQKSENFLSRQKDYPFFSFFLLLL